MIILLFARYVCRLLSGFSPSFRFSLHPFGLPILEGFFSSDPCLPANVEVLFPYQGEAHFEPTGSTRCRCPNVVRSTLGQDLSRLRSSEWEATMVTLHLVNREVPATRQWHLMSLMLVSVAAIYWRVIDTSRAPLSIPRRKSPRPCGAARSFDGGPR